MEESLKEMKTTAIEDESRLTDLQNLPIEILDMILLKVIMIRMKPRVIQETLKREDGSFPVISKLELFSLEEFDREIKSLRIVWSEWNNRITTRWFWIKLKRFSGKIFVTRWKRSEKVDEDVSDMTTLGNRIYVLCRKSIRIYTDVENFRLQSVIPLEFNPNVDKDQQSNVCYKKNIKSETECEGYSIHSSAKSNCLYIIQRQKTNRDYYYEMGIRSILKLTVDDTNLSPLSYWMTNIKNQVSLTVTRDDNVLILMQMAEDFKGFVRGDCARIFLYNSDAELIKSIELPEEIHLAYVWNIIETSQGNFIICHSHYQCQGRCKSRYNYFTSISQIDTSGQILNNLYIPSYYPAPNTIPDFYLAKNLGCSLSVDKVNNLLFITNAEQSHIFIIDSKTLSGIQTVKLYNYSGNSVKAFKCFYFDWKKQVLFIGNERDRTIDAYRVFM